MIVRVSRQALLDFAEVEAWVAKDNPRAAVRLGDQLVSACRTLGRFARRYPAIGESPFRKRPVGAYVNIYRLTDEVEIVRVLHGARDWSLLLPWAD
jgi:plasmid stabilization system protein ParE